MEATEARAALPAAGLRAHVWIEARCFFSRENAQTYCWLWLLGGDGHIHALRLAANAAGRDDRLPALLGRLNAEPSGPLVDDPVLGRAWRLPRAPVVPLPRWAVSWGHPIQQAIRVFAAQLDEEVLAALGRLEVPGPFFGSVENYNSLAMLPQPIRRRRLQALAEFPPLVAPVLLDQAERPDMFGEDEDEPPGRSNSRNGSSLLDAMDGGRDLIGALAAHYRVDRALVRSPLFRAPSAAGCVSRGRLRLLNAIPAHARPRERKAFEKWLPCLEALPTRPRATADMARLAQVFAPGWSKVWRTLDARFRPLAPSLRDTRDFLHAALDEADLPPELDRFDAEMLGLAWLVRRGPLSLLEASRRWHGEPLVEEKNPGDGLPEAVPSIVGDLALPEGHAQELATRASLIAEGGAMHHCVGGYWARCALDAIRIVHLETAGGETATAQYDCNDNLEHPRYALVELRGPCNRAANAAMRGFAKRVAKVMNAPENREHRARAIREAAETRTRYRPGAGRRTLRPLDRRSRQELCLVLAWCLKQKDWLSRPDELFRGPIAGFAYARGPGLIERLTAGDMLGLAREPDNQHDPLAVRVDWNGHKLGYVPRSENAPIARRLDAGLPVAAEIVAIRPGDDPWSQVQFTVLPADA